MREDFKPGQYVFHSHRKARPGCNVGRITRDLGGPWAQVRLVNGQTIVAHVSELRLIGGKVNQAPA